MSTTSISLLRRLRKAEQDDEAWKRFVEIYTPLLFYWARKIGLSSEEASDLVQEVFAILVQRLPEFEYDSKKNFRGWLRTITVNKCYDFLRRRARSPGNADPTVWRRLAADDDTKLFSEEEYRGHLVRRAMRIMQSDFQPNTWKACWELVVAGRPAAEVAQELEMTVGAVYVAKCRVLRRLREELDGLLS